MKKTKLAIVGSGISGLGLSYIAQHNNLDITLFEQNNYFGGHSNTIDLSIDGKNIPVDTGFLVHNKVTYPNLIQLFDLLNVEIVDSKMTLSIQVEEQNLEWGGTNLNTVFGQRRNIFKIKFHRLLLEILDFNKRSIEFLNWAKEDEGNKRTLNDLLINFNYSTSLRDWYIVPMAAAIWSTPANKILEFPAFTFLTFCLNHHLLQVNDRPVWRTVKNGSRNYVKKITDLIADKRLNQQVLSAESIGEQVKLKTASSEELFDTVVFTTHPELALKIVKNPSKEQNDILSSFKSERNKAYVHSDISFLPKRNRLWSSWNYATSPQSNKVSVSYLINELQPLETDTPVIVTLNPHKAVLESKIFRVIDYSHPLFDHHAIDAQKKLSTIQGNNSMYFCGAWEGYGFHEDGLKSAIKVAQKLNLTIPWKIYL